MSASRTESFYNLMMKYRHPIFFIGLLFFFIFPEIIKAVSGIKLRFPLLITILIFSGMPIIHATKKKRALNYGIAGFLVSLMILWNFYDDSTFVNLLALGLLFIYFSVISYNLFLDIRQPRIITSSLLIGAFTGYFIVGVLYFFIFSFIDVLQPNTVNLDVNGINGFHDMFYFSFITLTTIGYGDFAPTSILGQKIAILEGLTGQFYIATVMAIFVGKFISNKKEN